MTIDLPGRPPAPVESAAYFAVAEALANVAQALGGDHGLGPAHATSTERLHILVGDDGVGGADGPTRRRSVRNRTAAGRLRRYLDRGQPDRRADHRDHGVALRVVIAEDHALLRDGLIRLLEAHDFEVVEAVDNGPRLVPALVEHRPDVAVVDVRLPPTFTDEGLQGGDRGPPPGPRPADPGAFAVRRTALRPGAAHRRRRRGRLPAQGPGLERRRSSSTPSAGSPPAVPRWTRR